MSVTRSAEAEPSGLLPAPSPASGPRPSRNPSRLVTELRPVPSNSPLTTQRLSLLRSSRALPGRGTTPFGVGTAPRQGRFFTSSKLGPPYVIGVRAVPWLRISWAGTPKWRQDQWRVETWFWASSPILDMEDVEVRFAHLLQPIRDLTKNWEVDVAAQLGEYLEEVRAAGEWHRSGDSGGIATPPPLGL